MEYWPQRCRLAAAPMLARVRCGQGRAGTPAMQRSERMRKSLYALMATLLLTGLLSGCGSKQTADQSLESPSDSLLASNPSEQTPGNITPQTEYQPQQEAPPPNPAPTRTTSKPKPKPAPPAPAPAPQHHGVSVPVGT